MPRNAPADPASFDEFVSDPAHPVPYRHRPIQPTYFPGGSKWGTWLVEDQRFVDDRADVAASIGAGVAAEQVLRSRTQRDRATVRAALGDAVGVA